MPRLRRSRKTIPGPVHAALPRRRRPRGRRAAGLVGLVAVLAGFAVVRARRLPAAPEPTAPPPPVDVPSPAVAPRPEPPRPRADADVPAIPDGPDGATAERARPYGDAPMDRDAPPLLAARGLTRSFKTKTGTVDAVKGVDFEVAPGEIVGLLGPNGAGKTTTLRMLTTLLAPTAGTATVAGYDLARDPREVRRRIGYVAQIGAAPSGGQLLGAELVTQARLFGLSKAAATERLHDLAPRLDLGDLTGRALSELSGGQRRRFDVALGLMHSPALVFLDEPTTGLDPQSRANLWDHIRSLRAELDTTVIITTHYLDEADALCDRILVMDNGEIVADDTPSALKARIAGDVVVIELADFGRADDAEAAIRGAATVRDLTRNEPALHINVEDGALAVAPVVRALDAAGIRTGSIGVSRPSLDDVFLTLTGRSLRETD